METTTNFGYNITDFLSTTEDLDREIGISVEDPHVTSLTSNIIITVIIAIFLLIGSVGNILTLIVIAKTKSLHIPSNYFIVSLCVSDLVSSLLCSPLWWYRRTWGFVEYGWAEWSCNLYWVADFTTNYATALHILSFAIVRFIAVKRPFYVHSLTRKKVVPFIILIWILSVLLALPLLWFVGVDNSRIGSAIGKDWPACSIMVKIGRECCYQQYNLYMTIAAPLFFYCPELLIIFFSVTIARALLRRRRWMQGFSSIYSNSDQMQGVNSSSSIKSNLSWMMRKKTNKSSAAINRTNIQSTNLEECQDIEKKGNETAKVHANEQNRKKVELTTSSSNSIANKSYNEDRSSDQETNFDKSSLHSTEKNETSMQSSSSLNECDDISDQSKLSTSEDDLKLKRSQNEDIAIKNEQDEHFENVPNLMKSPENAETSWHNSLSRKTSGRVNLAYEHNETLDCDGFVSKKKEQTFLKARSISPNHQQEQAFSLKSFSLNSSENFSTNLCERDDVVRDHNGETICEAVSLESSDYDETKLNHSSCSSFETKVNLASKKILEDINAHISKTELSEKATEEYEQNSKEKLESYAKEQWSVKSKNKLPRTRSLHSIKNYGTINEHLKTTNKVRGRRSSVQVTEDEFMLNRLKVPDINNGSLPVAFDIGNMKIRSASFYNFHQNKTEKQPILDSNIIPMKSLRGNFKTRNNSSFYETIYEEPPNNKNGADDCTSTTTKHTHQRRASENYPNPVLYNRKTSIMSSVNEARRENSLYKERGRRTTAVSERSVFSGTSSRRSSGASLALERQYQQERATFFQLCMINISFMIGYIPITIYFIWTSNVSFDSRYSVIDYWFGVVAYFCLRFSECMNPIIYNFSSGNIRDATKVYLRGVFKRNPSPDNS